MKVIPLVLVVIVAMVADPVRAQDLDWQKIDTIREHSQFARLPMFTEQQLSLPVADSCGRAVKFGQLLTNLTDDTLRFEIHRANDSAYWLADSLRIAFQGLMADRTFDRPWRYVDTTFAYENGRWFVFYLPPHQQLYVPQDFVSCSASESLGEGSSWCHTINMRTRTWSNESLEWVGVMACPGPKLDLEYGIISNENDPVYYGDSVDSWKWSVPTGDHVFREDQLTKKRYRDANNKSYDAYFSPDSAYQSYITFEFVGEYADRFSIPANKTRVWDTLRGYEAFEEYPWDAYKPELIFHGAPKSVIHDTLIATYTNCWGTREVRYAIEAHSRFIKKHTISLDNVSTMVVPFLGETSRQLTIMNNRDIPLEIAEIQHSDPKHFFTSGPSVIAAHGSGTFTITLKDNDPRLNLSDNNRLDTQRILSRPQGFDFVFTDSFILNGRIELYCPNYFSYAPQIKHGVHPRGIIFGPHDTPFELIFTNGDSESRLFQRPYFEDPLFSVNVKLWEFPLVVEPSPSMLLVTDIEYANPGDGRSRLTRLVWPRDIDTVYMDVLVVGDDAMSVGSPATNETLRIWPNPASTVLRIESEQSLHGDVIILDALGRVVRRSPATVPITTIDIGDLPAGAYYCKLQTSDSFEIRRFSIQR